jgi:hypothetical protein
MARALREALDVADVASLARKSAPLALVYSPESIRAGWLFDYVARESASPSPPIAGTGALSAWSAVLGDLGVDFKWVSTRSIELGELTQTPYTAVILPETWCLSRRTVEALAIYAGAGGTVVADSAAGLLDGDYQAYEKPPINALFGIKREGLTWSRISTLLLSAGERAGGLVIADDTVEAAGKAQATASPSGTVEVLNAVGRGGAVFLNSPMRFYEMGDEATKNGLAASVRLALSAAGHTPEAQISQKDRVLPAHISARTLPNGRMIFVQVAPQAVGFDRTQPVEVRFLRGSYMYNLRPQTPQGEAYGYVDRVLVNPPESGPIVLLETNLEITGLPLEVEFDGRALYVRAALTASTPTGTRLLAIAFYTPSGTLASHLGRTVAAEQGTAILEVPLPVNSPRGVWRILVRDLSTGITSWADVVVR